MFAQLFKTTIAFKKHFITFNISSRVKQICMIFEKKCLDNVQQARLCLSRFKTIFIQCNTKARN